MKIIALSIYLVLGIGLLAKVGMTAFQVSSVMHHNAVVAQLQTEKQQLSEKKQHLESQLASQQSLQTLLSSADEEYIELSQPVVIHSTVQLAAEL